MIPVSKRARVDAALAGQPVDRVPVSAWRHFIPAERDPAALAAASLEHFHSFDWDWLKVNPRATSFAEAWGNSYDLDDYHGVLPRLIGGPLSGAETPDALEAGLRQIAPVDPTGGVFAEQLALLRHVQAGIGGAHFIQTVFSPLSVLAFLLARPGDQAADLGLESRFGRLRQVLHDHPAAAQSALNAITQTLAGYASATLRAGASGIFFAIVRLARADVLTRAEYLTFGKPYDLRVLHAVQDAPFNLLHICGPQVYFDDITSYPVQAINWDAVAERNLTIGAARSHTDKALVGGVDETSVLRHGSPAEVIAAAQQAIEAAPQGFLLTPGCGLPDDVPDANLHALRQAAEAVNA